MLANIPKQGIGANVTIEDGVIKMVTLSPERDNPNSGVLKTIHLELLAKAKTAAQSISPVDNQYPKLGIIISADDINFTTAFIRGIDLKAEYESILRASQTDQTGEYPEISQVSSSALDNLLDLHQTFIGLSDEGSTLLDAFAKASRSPTEEKQYRADIQEFAIALQDTPELIDVELAGEIFDLANVKDDDPNRISKWEVAGRYSRHVLILAGAVVSVGVPGVIISSVAGPLVGNLASIAVGLTIKDAYKKSKTHKEITSGITGAMDAFFDGDAKLLKNATSFIRNQWQRIRPIAEVNGLDVWFAEIHSPIYERVNDSMQDISQSRDMLIEKRLKE